jgi:DNA-binding MarR family transcriptional regulator
METWRVDEHIPALLTWVTTKVASVGSHIYQERFDLGIGEWRVLSYIGVFGKGTNRSIYSFIGVDKAAVSRSVTRLKERGLIEVTPIDGRTTELTLTPTGREIGNQMLKFAERMDQELMHGISSEDRQFMVTTIKKMLANLPRLQELANTASAE